MKQKKIIKKLVIIAGLTSLAGVAIIPIVTSCSGIKTLKLSKQEFSFADGADRTAWVIKGWNDSWRVVQLYQSDSLPRKAGGLYDLSQNTLMEVSNGIDWNESKMYLDTIPEDSVRPGSGDYTFYGYAWTNSQLAEFQYYCARYYYQKENPNYNPDAKIPGTRVKIQITLL